MDDHEDETPQMRPMPPAVVPYGGDLAVARSIAAVHVRNPWNARCRACRERYPCPDRRDADTVLGRRPVERRHIALLLTVGLVAALTVALIAAAVIR